MRFNTILMISALGASAVLGTFAEGKDAPRAVDLGWDPVEGATSYQVEVLKTGASGEPPQVDTVAASRWERPLTPGLYNFRMRSLDRRRVPGPWSPVKPLRVPYQALAALKPAPNGKIKSGEEATAAVTFAWQAVPEGVDYKLEIFDSRGKPFRKRKVASNEAAIDLPVGASYSWQVVPEAAGKPVGEAPEARRAFVLLGASPEAPRILSPDDDELDQRRLSWSRPEYAKAFRVSVAVQNGKKWKTLLDQPNYPGTTLKYPANWTTGQYRLQVASLAPMRETAPATVHEFEITSGDVNSGPIKRAPRFVRVGMVPSLLTSRLSGYEPEPQLNVLLFSSYDMYARLTGLFSFEAGYTRKTATVFEGGDTPGGGDALQPELEYVNDRLNFSASYLIALGRRVTIEPLLGVTRRSIELFLPTEERTLELSRHVGYGATIGSDLEILASPRDTLRSRLAYQQLLSSPTLKLKGSNYFNVEQSYVRAFGPTGLTIATGVAYDWGAVRFRERDAEVDGRLTETLTSLLLATGYTW